MRNTLSVFIAFILIALNVFGLVPYAVLQVLRYLNDKLAAASKAANLKGGEYADVVLNKIEAISRKLFG